MGKGYTDIQAAVKKRDGEEKRKKSQKRKKEEKGEPYVTSTIRQVAYGLYPR